MAQLLAAGLISMYDILLPPDIKGLSVLLIFSSRKILGELCIFMFIFILTFCFFLFLLYFHFNDHCFTVLYTKKNKTFRGLCHPGRACSAPAAILCAFGMCFLFCIKPMRPYFFLYYPLTGI